MSYQARAIGNVDLSVYIVVSHSVAAIVVGVVVLGESAGSKRVFQFALFARALSALAVRLASTRRAVGGNREQAKRS